ncbi:MAG: hypothetical protein B9S33_01900 [Pedosphaera sp. Tous-C6FEB]|nr:MAG: hypothetical protein B9S33_01900 [Pedosphaera sp. Tous-C6FEB]
MKFSGLGEFLIVASRLTPETRSIVASTACFGKDGSPIPAVQTLSSPLPTVKQRLRRSFAGPVV